MGLGGVRYKTCEFRRYDILYICKMASVRLDLSSACSRNKDYFNELLGVKNIIAADQRRPFPELILGNVESAPTPRKPYQDPLNLFWSHSGCIIVCLPLSYISEDFPKHKRSTLFS